MTNKTTDQILLESIQGLREDIARIDRDTGKDREKSENLAMAVVANTEQVKKLPTMTNKTTDQILLEAIQGLREDIARIDRDTGKDREKSENLAMAVVANTEQVKQFGQKLEVIEKKIQDKMADVVSPLMDQIEDRKIVEYKSKPRWKFWERG